MRPKVDARYGVPLLGPIRVALVLIYPLREGSEKPPFPSRLIVPIGPSPSRVRFAASRPGRLGPIEGMTVYEGKGGGPVGPRAGR